MYHVTSRMYSSRKMIDRTGASNIISSYNHNDRRQLSSTSPEFT